MRLSELDPRWITGIRANHENYGDRRGHIGLSFLCPHCRTQRLAVFFDPPIDDGVLWEFSTWPSLTEGKSVWGRTGESFETLTLTPSINADASGHWHGFITNGEIR